ncbi:hypothetical protein B0H19DRAFT_1060386 [Mycena capillaripes]|nr:hypothetical protein B0H19DRAFT_1060386 [Mycena capillaripes]
MDDEEREVRVHRAYGDDQEKGDGGDGTYPIEHPARKLVDALRRRGDGCLRVAARGTRLHYAGISLARLVHTQSAADELQTLYARERGVRRGFLLLALLSKAGVGIIDIDVVCALCVDVIAVAVVERGCVYMWRRRGGVGERKGEEERRLSGTGGHASELQCGEYNGALPEDLRRQFDSTFKHDYKPSITPIFIHLQFPEVCFQHGGPRPEKKGTSGPVRSYACAGG